MNVAPQEALQAQRAYAFRVQYPKRDVCRLVHDGEGLTELLPGVGHKVLPAQLRHENLLGASRTLKLAQLT